jgi:hypothetical protein
VFRIEELKKLRSERLELEKRERELERPVLTDLSLLPTLYGWFGEILDGMSLPPCPDSVMQRKKFLFVVMALYCPEAILGDRIRSGLREALSEVLNVSACVISKNMNDLLFMYSHCSKFMSETERTYGKILMRIKKMEH